MILRFATCDPQRAKGFLRRFYPKGYHECAELDAVIALVSEDVIRIPDPDHHGGEIVPQPGASPEQVTLASTSLLDMHNAFILEASK